jgi:hypothetical protein
MAGLLAVRRFPVRLAVVFPGRDQGQLRRHRCGNQPQHIRSLPERLAAA